jgi:ribonuclease I
LAAASSAGAHDCQCRFAGQKYDQGTTVCMRGKVAECGMFLNNSSWNVVAETCPQVRAPQVQQPRHLSRHGDTPSLSPCALPSLHSCCCGAPVAAQAEPRAGAFDYYMLALSWSPTYCASPAGRDDAHQCGLGRRYDFVVHGLWPQYRNGWPQYCDSDARLSDALVDAMLDIMPRAAWSGTSGTSTGPAAGWRPRTISP